MLKPFEVPRHAWEDNIKVDLKKLRWDDAGLVHLA
jgi:hypothetical protein